MESTLNRNQRGITRRARKGKVVPGGLSEGVGAVGYGLEVDDMAEEAESDKEDWGGLLRLGQSST